LFEQSFGVPLEDAGGGWHAVLGNSHDGFREGLTAGGFTVNAMELDYAGKRVTAHVAGRLPDGAAVAGYSREAAEHGFGTKGRAGLADRSRCHEAAGPDRQ
jgi:hypothetical protein